MGVLQGLRVEVASFSENGGRDYNEDALGHTEAFGAVGLFVLADGAGGMGGGAAASRLAVEAAQAEFLGLPAFAPTTLRRCITKADEKIRTKQLEGGVFSKMASTFVGLLMSYQNGHALMGNLGDSRCYVFRGDRILAQSYDHSLVQRFVDAGLYPLERLRQHPRRNVLYASLGANDEAVDPHISAAPIELQAGDGILLCSDGVWEILEESSLARLHAEHATLNAWRDALLAAVQERMPPGHDNSSALLLRCVTSASASDDELSTVRPS